MSELGHSGKYQGVQREPNCTEVGSYTLSFYKQQRTGHLRKNKENSHKERKEIMPLIFPVSKYVIYIKYNLTLWVVGTLV